MKSYWNHNKDLKVKHLINIPKKLTRFHWAVMMIKDCKDLIKLHNFNMVKVLE